MSWFEHGTSRIYYEDSGGGATVLLLPGLAGSIDDLSALRLALLSAGYRVIAADLPGSGRSEPQPRSYPTSYYEDDARSFASLLRHLGAEPAHLIGFSDGGEVELLMAAMIPLSARSVVTWGATGQIYDPEGQIRDTFRTLIDNPVPPMQGFSDYLKATYGVDNARAMMQSVARAFDAIVASGNGISLTKVDAITCPVLLITGEHDFFAPPALVSELATRIPNAQVRIVSGAGHDVQNSHPDWLAETVLDWLTSQ